MREKDQLFESLLELSDAAFDRNMMDLSMVLEFALDVYLREVAMENGDLKTATPLPQAPAKDIVISVTNFPLASVMQRAG